jgi:hypothetical protein
MDERGLRVGRNEVVFREVNERLRDLGESFNLVAEHGEFVCECGNLHCTEHVQMTLQSYEEIRSDPKRFFVINGHELLEYEKVVDEREGFLIVEKLPGGPAGIAIRDDPRS